MLNNIVLFLFLLGMYYLRTKAAASAIQFTVDKTKLKASEANNAASAKTGNGSPKKGKKPEVVIESEESSVDGQVCLVIIFIFECDEIIF